MSAVDQIQLIDDLIKEDGDVTIRVFLMVLQEIEFIERSTLVREFSVEN